MKKSLLCLFLAVAMLLSTSSMMIACAAETVSDGLSINTSADTDSTSSDDSNEAKLPTSYVDKRYGTANWTGITIEPGRPNGSILPGPDTYPGLYTSGYFPDKPIRGFSQTHISAGGQKYGNFLISPQIGLATAVDGHDSEKANEIPGIAEYSVTLTDYDIDVSLAPTEHAVIYKLNYPEADNASLVFDVSYNLNRDIYAVRDLSVNIETDGKGNTIITGYGDFDIEAFCPCYLYFYAVVDKEATNIGTFFGSETSSETTIESVTVDKNDPTLTNGIGAFMQFATEADEEIKIKLGVSFTSVEKAKEWLGDEIPAWDYDAVVSESLDIWNALLGKIEISGEDLTDDQKTMFYSNLASCYINPRDLTDDIAKFDDADMVDAHHCVWDTFRTLYPLYSLTNTEFYAKTINSFVSRLDVNGYVRDTLHGGVDMMRDQGGNNVDNIIVEGYLKGIEGVDWEEAYRVIRDNAENWRDDQNSNNPIVGAPSTYRTLGYIPGDGEKKIMCCSKTLEYAYNDYLAAMMAKGLGYTEDYEKYIKRSENWKNLWNAELENAGFTGYIWPKSADGETWIEFDEYLPDVTTYCGSWKPYFYEATAYSYAFYVPHDVETVMELMGGEETFISRIQTGIDNGWIDIGNQPGFLQAFFFNYTSEPWHTTDYVEKLLDQFTIEGPPGADDSGSMCAWYLFSSMGFFPNAGQDYYYLTSPKYENITFNLDNEKTFTIKANNLSDENKYIQSVTLNGEPLARTTIKHSEIIAGGELVFNMGNTPINYAAVKLNSGSVADGNYQWEIRSNGTLTIFGTGDGTLRFDSEITEENLNAIPWYSVRDSIEKVIITEDTGITSAAAFALSNLPNLESITLPSTLTDLSASGIFAANAALTTVKSHANSESYGEIDLSEMTDISADLFAGSSAGLTVTVRLGDCDFAPVKWFDDTTTVNFFINGRSSAETWINNVKNSVSDTRADGYKFIVGSVDTVIGGEETGRYSWTLDTQTGTLTFKNEKNASDWNELAFTSSLTTFTEWVKIWKDEIEHIVIPSFGKITISSDTSPFAGLTNLKTVKTDTTRFSVSGFTLFENCTALTTLGTSSTFKEGKIILNGFTIEDLKNGDANLMFTCCEKITSVDLTGALAYYNDKKIAQELMLHDSTFEGCTSLSEVILGDTTVIGANTFKNCTALESITIPANVEKIGAGAFDGCAGLTSVTLKAKSFSDGMLTKASFPDKEGLTIYCQTDAFKASLDAFGYSLTKIESLRYAEGSEEKYSWSLDRETGILTFKRLITSYAEISFSSSLTKFSAWVKEYGDEIKHIVIPEFSKFSLSVDSPFANLKNLETVKIDTIRWASSTSVRAVFEGCSALTSFGTSKSFEAGKVKLDGLKFDNMSGNPKNIFKNCTAITSVDLTGLKIYSDNVVTEIAMGIGDGFLSGCSSVTEIILGGAVSIDASAFKGCTSLKSITIPETVTSIASNAFSGCTALTSVTLETESYTDGLMTNASFPDRDGLIIYCQNKSVADSVNALGYILTKAVNVNITAESGIKMEGFSIRTEGYNGLRGIFSFDNSAIATNEAEGLTLVEYGAIFASEANKNAYGTALTYNGTDFVTANAKVLKKAVWANGRFVGSILESSSNKQTNFAIAIVNYSNNYDTNVCMLGYSVWQDAAGNNYIKYVDCDNDDFDATSIYAVTLGMYKDGAVNASNDPDCVIWGVLEACAATLKAGTDYRDGDRDLEGNAFGSAMKFANIPLYKATGGSTATGGYWNDSTQKELKALSFTKHGDQTFTILPDGDDYVVVFRGTGALPTCGIYASPTILNQLHNNFNSYNTYASGARPTAYLYDANGDIVGYVDEKGNKMQIGYDYSTASDKLLTTEAYRRQPTPTFTSAAMNKFKTVIIDSGITTISNSYFVGSYIYDLVYAETVKKIEDRAFTYQKYLTTVSPKGTDHIEGIIDLSGFTSFGASAFNEVAKENNVYLVLPKNVAIPTLFPNVNTKIVAISTDRSTLKNGMADLRGITSLGANAFSAPNISKVYFDDSIKTLDTAAFGTQAMTVYTNGSNVAIVATFAAANSARIYLGGTSFIDAGRTTVLEQ